MNTNKRKRALIRATKALQTHEQYELVMSLKDCMEVLQELGETATTRRSGSLYTEQAEDEEVYTIRDRLMKIHQDQGPIMHEDQGPHGPRWWTLTHVYSASIDRRQMVCLPRQPPAWDA